MCMPRSIAANMADESQTNIVVFLQNIPSLISEARRQLFCENINVIEFIQRRIENSLQVLGILLNRSQERGCDNQLQNNISTLFSELQGLQENYERLCIQNDHSHHFSCPVEVGRNRGRGRYVLPENSISGLWRIHHSWVQVAADLGVSYRTLLRRRHEFGLPVSDSRGPRSTYSNISQTDLCNVVREVLQILPNAGETFVLGALRQRGIIIQRWRVRDAICHVDPLTRAMRRSVAIIRRVYNVPCPNALW